MIDNKKDFTTGLALMASFLVVLITMFLPIFDGRNILMISDELFNSISKHSANYFATIRPAASDFHGKMIDVDIRMMSPEQAAEAASLFRQGGAQADKKGSFLRIRGDLGDILTNCLNDSEAMYQNNAKALSDKYGFGERRALYSWWISLKALDRALKHQNRFPEAKIVTQVKKKAVETAYNYYGIKPQKIIERLEFVALTLLFYVIYTLWYGFAILFMFEGWGLKLKK